MARKFGMKYDLILRSMVYALHFKATDENGNMLDQDIEFSLIQSESLVLLLQEVCGFDPIQDRKLIHEFKNHVSNIEA